MATYAFLEFPLCGFLSPKHFEQKKEKQKKALPLLITKLSLVMTFPPSCLKNSSTCLPWLLWLDLI